MRDAQVVDQKPHRVTRHPPVYRESEILKGLSRASKVARASVCTLSLSAVHAWYRYKHTVLGIPTQA